MKKRIWVVMGIFLLSYGLTMAQEESLAVNSKYGDKDTVYLDSVYSISANQKGIPFVVNFVNAESLGGIRIPLTYYNSLNTDIHFDSISWSGSRVEYVQKKEIYTASTSNYDDKKFLIKITPFPDEMPVPPGTGLLCTLYFHTGPEWDNTKEVEVDTTRLNHICFSFIHKDFICRWIPNLPWKGLLSGESTSDVEGRTSSNVPDNGFIACNYPNPFNPTTTIEFSSQGRSKVKLEIYNVLGQKVRTLLDETVSPGTNRIKWNARDERGNILPSGIYFYRIQIVDNVKHTTLTKVNKMTFVK